jgi:aryl-alcohol dehydrogenase-like predicted oxidoreductase
VTLFDTAQAYGFGASERLLAKALAGLDRSSLVIATKGGLRPGQLGGGNRDSSPAWIRAGVEASLRALGTHYIDLYQVHWPDQAVPFADTAGALARLVADGKIRHVGVSNFDAGQMAEFSATLPVETLQPPYHLFRRDIETEVLPYAAAHDIGVLAYGTLAHGLLTGHLSAHTKFAPGDWRGRSDMFTGAAFERNLRAVAELDKLAHNELGASVDQLATAWTLANPAVQVAIVGTRQAAHVDAAVAAADLHLDESVLAAIDEIVRSAHDPTSHGSGRV